VLATLLLFIEPVPSALAQSRESLIWLKRDLPPLTIFDGPKKGQGVIDQLLPLLIAGMPQYQHSVMRVNRARGLQMLHEPSLVCDAALNWSKEREHWIAFSIPVFRAMSNGLAVRRVDQEVLAPFFKDGEVDLAKLLASGNEKLGIIAERNYGEYLDGLLKQAPADVLTPHYGNDALGSLLQIRGTGKYLSGYIGCTDTPKGRQAIAEINQVLRILPRERLDEAYAAWLDPQSRSDYLIDTKAFFDNLAQP
jgi:uncharacterized protein (TIGR02285 family)